MEPCNPKRPRVGDQYIHVVGERKTRKSVVLQVEERRIRFREGGLKFWVHDPAAWKLYPEVPWDRIPKWIGYGRECLLDGQVYKVRRHGDWVGFDGNFYSGCHIFQLCYEGQWIPQKGDRICAPNGHTYMVIPGRPDLHRIIRNPGDQEALVLERAASGVVPGADLGYQVLPKHPWVDVGNTLICAGERYRVLGVDRATETFSAANLRTNQYFPCIDWWLREEWSRPSKWDADFTIGSDRSPFETKEEIDRRRDAIRDFPF